MCVCVCGVHCVCVCVHVCVCIGMYTCTYTHTHTCTCTCTYVCMYMYVGVWNSTSSFQRRMSGGYDTTDTGRYGDNNITGGKLQGAWARGPPGIVPTLLGIRSPGRPYSYHSPTSSSMSSGTSTPTRSKSFGGVNGGLSARDLELACKRSFKHSSSTSGGGPVKAVGSVSSNSVDRPMRALSSSLHDSGSEKVKPDKPDKPEKPARPVTKSRQSDTTYMRAEHQHHHHGGTGTGTSEGGGRGHDHWQRRGRGRGEGAGEGRGRWTL